MVTLAAPANTKLGVQISIHEATASDCTAVVSLLRKNFLHHLVLDPTYYHDPDTIQQTLHTHVQDAIRTRNPRIHIARTENGTTVGFMSCAIIDASYFDSVFERYASMYELYVEEKFRGMGIGRRLIAVAENFARTQGCAVLHLQTSTYNTKALNFYERCHFVDRQRHLYRILEQPTSGEKGE